MQLSNVKKNYKSILGVSLLAFLLWFMVKLNRTYDTLVDVPVRYTNLDSSLVFKFPQADMITVQFAGKGKDLLRLPFYNLSYQVDLSEAPLHLEINPSEKPQDLIYPADLNLAIKSIPHPRKLVLDLDHKVTRTLPVEMLPEINVKTVPGHLLVKMDSNPDSITVVGPSELFTKISEISIEQKSFANVSRPFRDKFKIKKVRGYLAKYYPSEVHIFFDVQRLSETYIRDVPVSVTNVPENHQVVPLPSIATVYVKGPEKALANLTSSDFRINIDFAHEWSPGIRKVKGKVITRADAMKLETIPAEFELIVEKGKVQ